MTPIFIFHDLKADKWINPFFAPNMNDAIRSVQQLLKKGGHFLAEYPQDYVLYQTGSISEDDGRLIPFPDPLMIQPLSTLKGGA